MPNGSQRTEVPAKTDLRELQSRKTLWLPSLARFYARLLSLGHFAAYSIAHLSGSAWQCLAEDSHMLHSATCCYMLLHCSRGKRHKAPDRFDGFDGFDDFDDFDDFLILVADMSTLCVSCGW